MGFISKFYQLIPQLQKLIIYGFGQLFNLVTPILAIPYIISKCGEENFGKSAVGMAISFFLMVFIDYGTDVLGVKEVAINREDNKKISYLFQLIFSIKTITFIIVAIFFSLVIIFVPYFQKDKLLFLFGLTVLAGQWLNPTWFLQAVEKVNLITILNIISKTIYIFGIFFFINQKEDYIWINFWWGLGMIIAHLIINIYIVFQFKIHFLKLKLSEVTSYLKKDFTFFTSQIFVSLQMYAPVIIIGSFGNNLLAGHYRVIEQVIVIFRTYILLFFNFIFPNVCYNLGTDFKKGLKSWLIFNGVNFVLIVFGIITIAFFSREIINYFISDLTQIEVASLILKIALLIPLFIAINIPLKQLLLALNFEKYYTRVTSLLISINLIGIVFFIQKYSLFEVFYSLIITELLLIIFYLYKLRDKIRFND